MLHTTRTRHSDEKILSSMGFIEDALSLCALLCSIEVSELPRPRVGAKRRRSDSDEAETVYKNEGGEDYAPRECPRAASLPLAFIFRANSRGWPSLILRHLIDEGVPFGTDREIVIGVVRRLFTTTARRSERETRRCLELLDDAGLLDAAGAMRVLRSSITAASANGALHTLGAPLPSIASFTNALQKTMPRGGEAPFMGRFLSSGGEPASDADDSSDVSGSFEDNDLDWSDTSDASGEEAGHYMYEEEEGGEVVEFDSDSDSFSWVHAD